MAAWTASWVSVTLQGANIVPKVRFTNGSSTFDKAYTADDVTKARVETLVDAEIARLNSRDNAFATFADVTPGDPIPPVA